MGKIADKKALSKQFLRDKVNNIKQLVNKFDSSDERSGTIIRKLIDELESLKIEYHLYHAYHECAKIEEELVSKI